MMIKKYKSRIVHIIYLDKKGKFTQRKIRIEGVKGGKVKAFCMDKQAPRIFVQDRILAMVSVQTRAAR